MSMNIRLMTVGTMSDDHGAVMLIFYLVTIQCHITAAHFLYICNCNKAA